MNCLEVYRRNLVHSINTQFRFARERPDEDPVHDFRVGLKRLTAFYHFLHFADPAIKAKKILKRYRKLFKSIGFVRDLHISINLIDEMGLGKGAVRTLRAREKRHFIAFQNKTISTAVNSVRVPSVTSFNLSEDKLKNARTPYLTELLTQICEEPSRISQTDWHKRRILLKRYHHTLDAFRHCKGYESDESELKEIRILEQLLGDWHDRVITANLVSDLKFRDKDQFLKQLQREEKNLLEAAKVYQRRFIYTHL